MRPNWTSMRFSSGSTYTSAQPITWNSCDCSWHFSRLIYAHHFDFNLTVKLVKYSSVISKRKKKPIQSYKMVLCNQALTDRCKWNNMWNILHVSKEKPWKITTCGRLDLETLGFWSILPRNFAWTWNPKPSQAYEMVVFECISVDDGGGIFMDGFWG
jgi:hypothetical protein